MESAVSSPYFYGGPIASPEDFYGRGETLRIIFERLAKFGSTSLIGERSSGKTSLLRYLMSDTARSQFSPDGGRYLFVYLDPQLGISDASSFYRELLSALGQPGTDVDGDEALGRYRVQMALKALYPKRAVVLVDEFEKITSERKFGIGFYLFLRGLANTYETCFITASTTSLDHCCPPEVVASPFPSLFRRLYLGSFTELEFAEFLTKTSQRSRVPIDAHAEAISALAGRFPFYVQMACSLYFDLWREHGELTERHHDIAQQRFFDEAAPRLRSIWSNYLTWREKVILTQMTAGMPTEDDEAVRILQNKGYVVDGRPFSSVLAELVRTPIADDRASCEPSGPDSSTIPGYGVWLDERLGEVWVDGERIPPVTRLEYKLLQCLYRNHDGICDKHTIVENVWSGSYINRVDDARIAKLISRLRQTLENSAARRYLVTVHGRGYKLVREGVRCDPSPA